MSRRIRRRSRASGDRAELIRMAFDINDLDPDLFPDDEPLDLRPNGGADPQGMSAPAPQAGTPPTESLPAETPPMGSIPMEGGHNPAQAQASQPGFDAGSNDAGSHDPGSNDLGNRPAEGALRATAESELNKSWEGGEGASDFLGLDEEMRAPAPQAPQPAVGNGSIPLQEPAPAGAPADEGLFGGDDEQSWLLENTEKPLHVPGTPSAHDGADSESREPALAGAAVAGSTFVEHRPQSGKGKGKRILMVVGLMIVASGATVLLSPKPDHSGEESARGLEPGRIPLEAPRVRRSGGIELTDPDGPPPTIERTPLSALPSDAELLDELRELAGVVLDGPIRLAENGTSSGESDLAAGEVTTVGPFSVFNPDGISTDDQRLAAANTPFGLPVAGGGSSPWETAMRAAESYENGLGDESFAGGSTGDDSGDAARASRTTQLLPDTNALLPSVQAHLNRAGDEDLANLWPGVEPPLDQMKRPRQLLTPRVGRVRVLIDDDEIFEGRLYAVGEGSLWLDTSLGRIALESQKVQDVIRVAGGNHTPIPGEKGSQNLTGLTRVGVRAPGGTIYGKVVKREGDHVTLIPDIGGRITLDGAAVESLGSEVRTTIVRLADASEATR